MQNLISGPHAADIASLKPKLEIPTAFQGVKGWRIAFSMDLRYKHVDPQVKKNTLEALGVFRELGADVEQVELGWTEECGKAALDHLGYAMMGCYLREFYEKDTAKMTSYARAFVEYSQRVTWREFIEAEMLAGRHFQWEIRGPEAFGCAGPSLSLSAGRRTDSGPEPASNRRRAPLPLNRR